MKGQNLISFKSDQYHFNVEEDIFIYRLIKKMMLNLTRYNTFIMNHLTCEPIYFCFKIRKQHKPTAVGNIPAQWTGCVTV